MITQHEQGIDWSLVEIPEIELACTGAATRIYSQYSGMLEFADAMQEAYIIVATNPDKVRGYGENYGYLSNWIYREMGKLFDKQARRQSKDVSWERLAERFQEASEE